MFPIKVDDVGDKKPIVTMSIIIICTLVYCQRYRFVLSQGLIPIDIVYSILHCDSALPEKMLTLFVSFFVHGGIVHLAGNMWYLWIFGSALEQKMIRTRFILLYCIFGVVSMLVQVANDPLSSIPIVGASGAIAGCMGLYLVIRPLSLIVFWIPPFFSLRVPSVLFLVGWFLLQWYNAKESPTLNSNVAWWAHIGGFIAGTTAGIYTRCKGAYRPVAKHKKRKTMRMK